MGAITHKKKKELQENATIGLKNVTTGLKNVTIGLPKPITLNKKICRKTPL